ncbi:MAG: CHAT domain-containing protein [Candidatus Aminicenantes bacterium]|nr:CHAT domain-containing protein [Candidatus Aminicenantes bacterium]
MTIRTAILRILLVGIILSAPGPELRAQNENTGGKAINLHASGSRSRKSKQSELGILYSQVLVFERLGQYDRAVGGCKEILALEPNFTAAYELLVQTAAKCDRLNSSRTERTLVMEYFQNLLNTDPDKPHYHYGYGLACKYAKQYTKAKEHFETSIALGARFWEVYEELIPYLKYKAELESLIAQFHQHIKRFPDNDCLYQGLAYIHFWLDAYDLSLLNYQHALAMQHLKGDRTAEANCLFYIGYLYMYLNDYDKASESIRRSIEISEETGDRFQLSRSLEILSFLLTERGNFSKAFELCRKAYSIARDISSEKQEIICARTLGVIHNELGNLTKAHEYLERSSAYYRDLGELQKLGITLYWETKLHKGIGDYSEAMACARQGLAIARQLGFKTGEAFHLSEIGDIYYILGNYDKALEYNKNALAISERYISKWSREECFNTIGYVYLELNKAPEALEHFKQALEYVRTINHIREEAECLYNIGLAHFHNNEMREAKQFFLSSLEKADKSGNKVIIGKNFCRLGELYCRSESYAESIQYYFRALSIGREMGHPNIIWEAYAGLGRVQTLEQKLTEAVDFYKKAIDVIEELRSQFLVAEHRSGYFQNKIRIYEYLVDLLYDLHVSDPSKGYDRECLFFAEKAKARAFLDDLRQAGIDLSSFFHERQNEMDVLSKKISHLLTKLYNSGLSGDERQSLLEEVERSEDELRNLIEFIKGGHPGYTESVGLEPLDSDAIQNSLLDEETGLISYLVGEENIFIFFCTKENIGLHRIPCDLSRKVLSTVKNYVKLVSARGFTCTDCKEPGKKLCELLIREKSNGFNENIDKLIIVPDRELHYLPFETLVCQAASSRNGERPAYLMERYGVSYAPSASTLFSIITKERKHENQLDLLAVGDPIQNDHWNRKESVKSNDIIHEYYLEEKFRIYPLKYAAKEIRAITHLLKKECTRLVLQKDASEEFVKSLPLDEFKIIHFATHSLLDEKNSNRSALVLNLDDDPLEDGFFQVREIYDTKLNAELVVLSACQTAKGKMEKGEGIQGLARAFFYAGAKSVLACLWKIDDRSTAEFMKYFYENLTDGMTKQAALIHAKMKMLDTEYRNPYYWASFILIGEAASRVGLQKSTWWDKLID